MNAKKAKLKLNEYAALGAMDRWANEARRCVKLCWYDQARAALEQAIEQSKKAERITSKIERA